ncbi:MAG: hypothetical protein HC893_07130, partial [Chloroflexaceae bacterium]|nr:hypothetical protein [Chloroflexaceae bacterium]
AAAAVFRARRLGHAGGLQFIYGSELNQPTQCPRCHNTLITRNKGVVRMVGLEGGACNNCGFEPYLRTSIFKAKPLARAAESGEQIRRRREVGGQSLCASNTHQIAA